MLKTIINNSLMVLLLGCMPFLQGCANRFAVDESKPIEFIFGSEQNQIVNGAYLPNDAVRIVLPDGSRVVLYRAISASGARYTNGVAEWWEHQGEATYSVGDKVVFSGIEKFTPNK